MNLKFALVGCGRIAYKHAEILNGQLDNTTLAAVCDIDINKAKSTGEKYGVPYYSSYDEMLSKEDVDVVNILTESGNHAVNTIDIVKKYQKHIAGFQKNDFSLFNWINHIPKNLIFLFFLSRF